MIRAGSNSRRILVGVGLALALSACQTPFRGSLWRTPAPDDRAEVRTPAPTDTERIAELLVHHAPDLQPV
ncbi:MAG TPA: hypothetical protein VEN47_01775, partial [Myxococcota bacterium]|nr:hypothetical protein [Myxococcota bacterium]